MQPQRAAKMSKVLVAIKRVIDYNARVRVKPDKARKAAAGPHSKPTAMQLLSVHLPRWQELQH